MREEARHATAERMGQPAKVRAKLDRLPPTRVVLWVAPGARWERLSPSRIRLSRGELLVQMVPTKAGKKAAFEVLTPAAAASAPGTVFFIDVRKRPRATNRVKPAVYVTVLDGRVRLSNTAGQVTGSRGTRLWAEEKSPPKKRALGRAALRKMEDKRKKIEEGD